MGMTDAYLDAQYGVLGSMLIDSRTVPIVMESCGETDFTGPCRTMFQAVQRLFLSGAPVDPITVPAEAGRDMDEAGKAEYQRFARELMEITPTAANVRHYISLVREESRLRAAKDAAHELLEADSLEQAQRILDQAVTAAADQGNARIFTMQDLLKNFFTRHTGMTNYLPWPVKAISADTSFEPGDFILIGGRPSTGKTAFSIQCAMYWAQRMRVGYFSLETNENKVFDRAMSGLAQIKMGQLKNNQISNEQWERVVGMNDRVIQTKLEIIRASGLSVSDIRATVLTRGYKLIVVDYLQLIREPRGRDRYQQVTNISMGLHDLAQQLGVYVVALCQLSRLGGKEHPGLEDLRESGQLEQDADAVFFLSLENQNDAAGPRRFKAAKNKEGELFQMLLSFDGSTQTFRKMDALEWNKYMAEQAKNAVGKGRKPPAEKPPAYGMPPMDQMEILPDDESVPFR